MDKLKKAEIKRIANYMLVQTELRPADICIVFGGANADHLADHAAELYRKGYFKKIIVSGGTVTDDGTLEADRMQARLVGWGVPAEDIIVEDKAANTGENVTYSMAMLDKEVGLENIKSVIAVGQIHASRRFLMTLERHCPNAVKMFSAPNYYSVAKENWYKDDTFRAAVLREYYKIAPYLKQGFITEVDMGEVARKIKGLVPSNDNKALQAPKSSLNRRKPPRF